MSSAQNSGVLDTSFLPPWGLRNGFAMTVFIALQASRQWKQWTIDPEPPYRSQVFLGQGNVPIFGWVAIPESPKGTIVGTYGITGTLENQWFLQILGRKAFAQGYAIVLFDWRAHGKTAALSPTLTSDGLYEGQDFIHIAAKAKALGCPPPFWFTGYSLGGQLALWGIKEASDAEKFADLGIEPSDLGGGAVICPSLDSRRSLAYLMRDPLGKYLEQGIARALKQLALEIQQQHPGSLDPAAIDRANSIWGFDHELVIGRLGFPSVEAYYDASSPLQLLSHLSKPTLILYAADDPLFDPTIVPDLQTACASNGAIHLMLTAYGGHVGYFSSKACQRRFGDPDPWWAWNRILQWIDRQLVGS
jgi:hypothetical protein